MNITSICSVCGRIATLTCVICGKPVCEFCVKNGMCRNCIAGKR